jgi:hypothetical protein
MSVYAFCTIIFFVYDVRARLEIGLEVRVRVKTRVSVRRGIRGLG